MNCLLVTFTHPGGARWVELYQRVDGLFWFQELYEEVEDMSHLGNGIYKYKAPVGSSGLYGSREGAEADLRKMAPGYFPDDPHE